MNKRDRIKSENEYKRSAKGIRKMRQREALRRHRLTHIDGSSYLDHKNLTSSTSTKPDPDVTITHSMWSKLLVLLRRLWATVTRRKQVAG